MRYGIDVSNYTEVPDLGTFAAIVNSERLQLLIAATDVLGAWGPLAEEFGLELQAYHYLAASEDYDQQLSTAAASIKSSGFTPEALWLDVEEGTPTSLQLYQALVRAQEIAGTKSGFYSRQDFWMSIGNPQMGRYGPLWVADWKPPPYTFDYQFGGWNRATVVQTDGDYTSYGITFDRNVWDD